MVKHKEIGATFSVSGHPLIKHKLSALRQSEDITRSHDYASLINELGALLGYEAAAQLDLSPIEKNAEHDGKVWRPGFELDPLPVIVSVVRPGLALAEGVRRIIPTPFMGHIALEDDSRTEKPYEVFSTMPHEKMGRKFIVCDLFIGRAWVTALTLDILIDRYRVPPSDIHFVCLVASVKGYRKLSSDPKYSGVTVHAAHLDQAKDEWLPDFAHTNYRLYRTVNKQVELPGYGEDAYLEGDNE